MPEGDPKAYANAVKRVIPDYSDLSDDDALSVFTDILQNSSPSGRDTFLSEVRSAFPRFKDNQSLDAELRSRFGIGGPPQRPTKQAYNPADVASNILSTGRAFPGVTAGADAVASPPPVNPLPPATATPTVAPYGPLRENIIPPPPPPKENSSDDRTRKEMKKGIQKAEEARLQANPADVQASIRAKLGQGLESPVPEGPMSLGGSAIGGDEEPTVTPARRPATTPNAQMTLGATGLHWGPPGGAFDFADREATDAAERLVGTGAKPVTEKPDVTYATPENRQVQPSVAGNAAYLMMPETEAVIQYPTGETEVPVRSGLPATQRPLEQWQMDYVAPMVARDAEKAQAQAAMQRQADYEKLGKIADWFDNAVKMPIEGVASPFVTGAQRIGNGVNELRKAIQSNDPDVAARTIMDLISTAGMSAVSPVAGLLKGLSLPGMAEAGLGGIQIGMNAIPGAMPIMTAVNAATPLATEIGGAVGAKTLKPWAGGKEYEGMTPEQILAIREKDGEELGRTIGGLAPMLSFGAHGLLLMGGSELTGEGARAILDMPWANDISAADKERLIEFAKHLGFVAGMALPRVARGAKTAADTALLKAFTEKVQQDYTPEQMREMVDRVRNGEGSAYETAAVYALFTRPQGVTGDVPSAYGVSRPQWKESTPSIVKGFVGREPQEIFDREGMLPDVTLKYPTTEELRQAARQRLEIPEQPIRDMTPSTPQEVAALRAQGEARMVASEQGPRVVLDAAGNEIITHMEPPASPVAEPSVRTNFLDPSQTPQDRYLAEMGLVRPAEAPTRPVPEGTPRERYLKEMGLLQPSEAVPEREAWPRQFPIREGRPEAVSAEERQMTPEEKYLRGMGLVSPEAEYEPRITGGKDAVPVTGPAEVGAYEGGGGGTRRPAEGERVGRGDEGVGVSESARAGEEAQVPAQGRAEGREGTGGVATEIPPGATQARPVSTTTPVEAEVTSGVQKAQERTATETLVTEGPFAGQLVDVAPTEAKKEAGNYTKAEIQHKGLKLTLENPKGSVRAGKDAKGKAWTTEMQSDYGYINGYRGKDKDHVDFFMGPNPDSDYVFIVNQKKPMSGSLDEHKVMLGYNSEAEAKQAYLSNYDKSWKRKQGGSIGGVSTDTQGLKQWLENADKKRYATKKNVSVQEPTAEVPAKAPVPAEGTAPRFVSRKKAAEIRGQIETPPPPELITEAPAKKRAEKPTAKPTPKPVEAAPAATEKPTEKPTEVPEVPAGGIRGIPRPKDVGTMDYETVMSTVEKAKTYEELPGMYRDPSMTGPISRFAQRVAATKFGKQVPEFESVPRGVSEADRARIHEMVDFAQNREDLPAQFNDQSLPGDIAHYARTVADKKFGPPVSAKTAKMLAKSERADVPKSVRESRRPDGTPFTATEQEIDAAIRKHFGGERPQIFTVVDERGAIYDGRYVADEKGQRIELNSAWLNPAMLDRVIAEEVFHWGQNNIEGFHESMMKWYDMLSPQQKAKFERLVMDQYGDRSPAEQTEEMTAKSMADMVSVLKEDRTLWQKFVDWVRQVYHKMLGSVDEASVESLKKMDMERFAGRMMEQAAGAIKEAEKTVVDVMETRGGKVAFPMPKERMSVHTQKDIDKVEEKFISNLPKKEQARARKAFQTDRDLISLLGPSVVDRMLRGEGGSAIKANKAPQYVLSVDVIGSCVRDVALHQLIPHMEEMARKYPHLEPSQILYASIQFLRARGVLAPCVACYKLGGQVNSIDSFREKVADWDNLSVLDNDYTRSMLAKYRDAGVPKEVFTPFWKMLPPERFDEKWISTKVDKWSPSLGKMVPLTVKQFMAGALGSNAKQATGYSEYTGNLLTRSLTAEFADFNGANRLTVPDFVNTIRDFGGFRFFSNSDHRPEYFVDEHQALAHLDALGSSAHGYTNLPQFVKAFDKTGFKTNMSVFVEVSKETGKVMQSFGTGMPLDVARRMQKTSENAGMVVIAKNPQELEWALKNPDVQYILPTHLVGRQGTTLKHMKAAEWKDFGYGGEEFRDPNFDPSTLKPGLQKFVYKDPKTGKYHIRIPMSAYCDFKNGDTLLNMQKKYFDICDKLNCTRRFETPKGKGEENYIYNERTTATGDYMKTVVDFARWDTPQKAIDITKADRDFIAKEIYKSLKDEGYTGHKDLRPMNVEDVDALKKFVDDNSSKTGAEIHDMATEMVQSASGAKKSLAQLKEDVREYQALPRHVADEAVDRFASSIGVDDHIGVANDLNRGIDRIYRLREAPAYETLQEAPAQGAGRIYGSELTPQERIFFNPLEAENWKEAFGKKNTVSSLILDKVNREPSTVIPFTPGTELKGPEDWAAMLMPLRSRLFESAKIAYLDKDGKLISAHVVSVGTIDATIGDPAIYLRNMPKGTKYAVMAHNHPSGHVNPSKADIQATQAMDLAFREVGVGLVDHVITDGGRYHSMYGNRTGTFSYEKPEWERVESKNLFLADSDLKTELMAEAMRQGDPNHAHAVVMTTQLGIARVQRFPLKNFDIRSGVGRERIDAAITDVIRSCAEEGSNRVSMDIPLGGMEGRAILRHVSNKLRRAGIYLVEASDLETSSYVGAGFILGPKYGYEFTAEQPPEIKSTGQTPPSGQGPGIEFREVPAQISTLHLASSGGTAPFGEMTKPPSLEKEHVELSTSATATKSGDPRVIVKTSLPVPKDVYDRLADAAKAFGGMYPPHKYSTADTGFRFRDDVSAGQFLSDAEKILAPYNRGVDKYNAELKAKTEKELALAQRPVYRSLLNAAQTVRKGLEMALLPKVKSDELILGPEKAAKYHAAVGDYSFTTVRSILEMQKDEVGRLVDISTRMANDKNEAVRNQGSAVIKWYRDKGSKMRPDKALAHLQQMHEEVLSQAGFIAGWMRMEADPLAKTPEEKTVMRFGGKQRWGIIDHKTVKELEKQGIYIYDGLVLDDGRIIGEYLEDGSRQLYREMSPDQAKGFYDEFVQKFPEAVQYLHNYIDINTQIDRVQLLGREVPVLPFNRGAMTAYLQEKMPPMKDKDGNIIPGTGFQGIENYVHSLATEGKSAFSTLNSILRKRKADILKYNRGILSASNRRDYNLSRATTEARINYLKSAIKTEQAGVALALTSLPYDRNNPLLPGYVPVQLGEADWRTVRSMLLHSKKHWEAKGVDINEVISGTYDLQTRWQIPKRLQRELLGGLGKGPSDADSQLANIWEKVGQGFNAVVNSINATHLIRPGTAATNYISGELQLLQGTLADVFHVFLTGGSKDAVLQAKNSLSVAFRRMSPSARRQFRAIVPDEVFDRNFMQDMGNVKGEEGVTNILLKPFQAVETLFKSRVWDSVVMADAERRALNTPGFEKMNEEQRKELVLGYYRNPTSKTIQRCREASDATTYDYANIPRWLQDLKRSTFFRSVLPYPTYFYKFATQLGRGLYGASAIVPEGLRGGEGTIREAVGLGKLAGKEKTYTGEEFKPDSKVMAYMNSIGYTPRHLRMLSHFLSTAGMIIGPYMMFVGGDDERKQGTVGPLKDALGEDYTESSVDRKFDVTNRIFGFETDNALYYLRGLKYPFVREAMTLAQMVKGTFDVGNYFGDLISLGGLFGTTMSMMGFETKYTEGKPTSSQIGERIGQDIPFAPYLNDLAQYIDPTIRQSYDKNAGFGQNFLMGLMSKLPGLSKLLPPKYDVQTGQTRDLPRWQTAWNFVTGLRFKEVIKDEQMVRDLLGVIQADRPSLKDPSRESWYKMYPEDEQKIIKDNWSDIRKDMVKAAMEAQKTRYNTALEQIRDMKKRGASDQEIASYRDDIKDVANEEANNAKFILYQAVIDSYIALHGGAK